VECTAYARVPCNGVDAVGESDSVWLEGRQNMAAHRMKTSV
jgi:hypothetical protein